MMAKRFLPAPIFCVCMLVACVAQQTTLSGSLQATPASAVPRPSRTPYPFARVPFEALHPYPTPEDHDGSCAHPETQALPEGVTPPVPVDQRYGAERQKSLYYLIGQKQIGRYAVRLWQSACSGWTIFTISAEGEILAQVEFWNLKVLHAGQDITGEGNPDVVVRRSDLGSMYHLSTQVYDLGPELTKVLDTPTVSSDPTYEVSCPWEGVFSDLEGDGSAEYLTCDDASRRGYYNEFCTNPYAEHRQLGVMAVLEYEPGRGYAPASPRFASAYADTIDIFTRQAEEQMAQEPGGKAGSARDALVALTFSYLYSGQPHKAWSELQRLHTGPDTVLLWSEILRNASESPFYVPGGDVPDVPVPDYYALQLMPGCEPNQTWRISILEKGHEPCDPGVALRKISWLEDQLSRADVIELGESLQVTDWDCTAKCRLEVLDIENDISLGFIELGASEDFPGEVVRVDTDGKEISRWRLRGDLTWEAAAP